MVIDLGVLGDPRPEPAAPPPRSWREKIGSWRDTLWRDRRVWTIAVIVALVAGLTGGAAGPAAGRPRLVGAIGGVVTGVPYLDDDLLYVVREGMGRGEIHRVVTGLARWDDGVQPPPLPMERFGPVVLVGYACGDGRYAVAGADVATRAIRWRRPGTVIALADGLLVQWHGTGTPCGAPAATGGSDGPAPDPAASAVASLVPSGPGSTGCRVVSSSPCCRVVSSSPCRLASRAWYPVASSSPWFRELTGSPWCPAPGPRRA